MNKITVLVSDQIFERLLLLVNSSKKPMHSLMQEAIHEYLKNLDDILLAEARVNEILAEEVAPVSLDIILETYGLAG